MQHERERGGREGGGREKFIDNQDDLKSVSTTPLSGERKRERETERQRERESFMRNYP